MMDLGLNNISSLEKNNANKWRKLVGKVSCLIFLLFCMEISLCTLEPSKAQRVSDSHSNAKILLGRNAISNKQTRNPQVFWDLQHFIILRVFFFFLICTAYNVDILKRGALTTYIVVKSSCVDEIYLNSENLLLLANWLPLLQKLSKLFWRARVTSEPRFTLVICFCFSSNYFFTIKFEVLLPTSNRKWNH